MCLRGVGVWSGRDREQAVGFRLILPALSPILIQALILYEKDREQSKRREENNTSTGTQTVDGGGAGILFLQGPSIVLKARLQLLGGLH